jgi:hypothetical protein
VTKHLEQVVLNESKPLWKKMFDMFENYFTRRFGPVWQKNDEFFKEFEVSLRSANKECSILFEIPKCNILNGHELTGHKLIHYEFG